MRGEVGAEDGGTGGGVGGVGEDVAEFGDIAGPWP